MTKYHRLVSQLRQKLLPFAYVHFGWDKSVRMLLVDIWFKRNSHASIDFMSHNVYFVVHLAQCGILDSSARVWVWSNL